MAAVVNQQGQESFVDRGTERHPRRVAGSKSESTDRRGTKKVAIPRFKQSTNAWKGKLEDKGPAKKSPEHPWAASVARPLPWGGSVAPAPREAIARRSDSRAWAPSTSASRAEELRVYAEAPGGDTSTVIWTGKGKKGGQYDKVGREGRVSRPDTPDDEQERHLPRFKRTTSAWKGKLDGKGSRKKTPEHPWAASIARPLPWGGPVAAAPREVIAKRIDNRAWAPSTSAARAEDLRKQALCPGGDTSTPIWTGKMETGDAHCSIVTTPEIVETSEEEEDESHVPAFKRKTTAWKGKLDGKGTRKKVDHSWAASVARPLPWGGAVSPLPPGAAARRADTKAWAPSTSASRAEALRKHAEAPGGDTWTPVWTGKMDMGERQQRSTRDGRCSSVSTSETPEEGDDESHLPAFKRKTTAWKGKLEGKGRLAKNVERPWTQSVARPLPWGGPVTCVPREAIARRSDNKAWAPSTSAARAEALRKHAEALGGDTNTAIWTGKVDQGAQNAMLSSGSVSTPETPDEAREDGEETHLPRFKRTTTAWKGKLDGKRRVPEAPARPWAASVARPLPWGGPVAPALPDPAAGTRHAKAWAPSTSVERADELRKELKYLNVVQQRRRGRSADVTPTPPTPPSTPPLESGGAEAVAAVVQTAAETAPGKREVTVPHHGELRGYTLQDAARSAVDDLGSPVVQDVATGTDVGARVMDCPVQADDDHQDSCRSSDVASADRPVGMLCGDAEGDKALLLGKASYVGMLAAAQELVTEAQEVVTAAEKEVADITVICEGAKEKHGAEAVEDGEVVVEDDSCVEERSPDAGLVEVAEQDDVQQCKEEYPDEEKEEVVLLEGKDDEKNTEVVQSPIGSGGAGVDAEEQEVAAPIGSGTSMEDQDKEDEEVALLEGKDDEKNTEVVQSPVGNGEAGVDAEVQEAAAPIGSGTPVDVRIQSPVHGRESLCASRQELASGFTCMSASRLPKPPVARLESSSMRGHDKGSEALAMGSGVVTLKAGNAAVAEGPKNDDVQVREVARDEEEGKSAGDELDTSAIEAHVQVDGSENVAQLPATDNVGQLGVCASGVPPEENAVASTLVQSAVKILSPLKIEATCDRDDTLQVQEGPAEDGLQKDDIVGKTSPVQASEMDVVEEEAAKVPVKKGKVSSTWAMKQAEVQREQPLSRGANPLVNELDMASVRVDRQAEGQQQEQKSEPLTIGAKSPIEQLEPEGADDGKLDVKMMCKLFARMAENK